LERQISEPVTLTFTHSEKEYVAATRLFYARVYHTRFRIVVSSIVLSLSLILVGMNLEVIFGSVIALAGLVFLLFNFYAHFVTPRQYFQHNAKFREEFNLRFSEEGLLFHSKDAESRLAWSFYSKVWETPQFYFLRYDNYFFTLIPKRVFTTEVQEAAFRDLLKRKISEYSETRQYLERRKRA
jgi:hypothetical protein